MNCYVEKYMRTVLGGRDGHTGTTAEALIDALSATLSTTSEAMVDMMHNLAVPQSCVHKAMVTEVGPGTARPASAKLFPLGLVAAP